MAGILAHDLVHAAVGVEQGHGPAFGKVARAVGLEGKLTATEPARPDRDLTVDTAVSQALRILARADLRAGRIADAERALGEALTLAKEGSDERGTALTS